MAGTIPLSSNALAMRCPVLTHALAMRCPVLTCESPIVQRSHDAMSGTDLHCPHIVANARYAMSSTEVGYGATRQRP
eukprot:1666719-Rhodomonas_salina.1